MAPERHEEERRNVLRLRHQQRPLALGTNSLVSFFHRQPATCFWKDAEGSNHTVQQQKQKSICYVAGSWRCPVLSRWRGHTSSVWSAMHVAMDMRIARYVCLFNWWWVQFRSQCIRLFNQVAEEDALSMRVRSVSFRDNIQEICRSFLTQRNRFLNKWEHYSDSLMK